MCQAASPMGGGSLLRPVHRGLFCGRPALPPLVAFQQEFERGVGLCWDDPVADMGELLCGWCTSANAATTSTSSRPPTRTAPWTRPLWLLVSTSQTQGLPNV